jgi:hypothetical protein
VNNQQRIEKNSEPITECGCWVWMGAVTNAGYGVCSNGKKTAQAHRVSYEAFVGEIPAGMIIAHTCDNSLCVNPNHLWLATHKQNSQDMVNKKRSANGEKCGKSKLTQEQVDFIKNSDLSTYKLGAMFNVSDTNIGYIKRGLTWNTRG